MSARVVEKAELPAAAASHNLVAWSLLAGILLWGALAAPFLAGRIYTADDLGEFHLPIRAFYADQLAQGQPYDWMPQLFSGFYLTGEGQGGAYHPLHQFLYRVFPLRVALGFEYLLPYPLMMLGMWLLLKRRLGRSDAAMFGGLLFAFSSFNLLHFVHPNAVAVIAHIPWLLWAIDVALTDSRRRRVTLALALIALLTGSQLLLGYPQYVWFSLIAEAAYVIFLQTTHKYAPRNGCNLCATCDACVGCRAQTWPRVLIAKGIGLLLGGAQLLPSLDAWLHSARRGVDAGFPFWGSLHPLNVLQLVAPYLFTGRVVGDNAHEFGLYLGAVPLMLIVWLVARRHELGALAPSAWFVMGFALVMLLLSFGAYGFLYPATTWLPLLGSFRFPCRYLVLFQLAAAGLATIGFTLLIRQSRLAQQRRSPWKEGGPSPSVRSALPAVAANDACPPPFLRQYSWWLERSWRGLWHDFEPLWCVVALAAAVALAGFRLRHEAYIAPLLTVWLGPGLLAAAAMLMVLAVRGYSAALAGLILLTAADLGWYGLVDSIYPSAGQTTARLNDYVASAATPPGTPDGRVLASLLRVDQPGLRTGDLMTLCGWRRADGYAGLEPRRQLDYRLLPALRVAGVRWVLGNASTVEIAGLKPCGEKGGQAPFAGTAGRVLRTNGACPPSSTWLEVPDPLPRVRLVSQTRTSTRPADDIVRICPDTTALCEVPLCLPPSKPGKAVLAAERPGRLAIKVDCPAAQLLAVAESYHEGWHATVDAQPQTMYRVNGDFMGCVVGPGKHRVVLSFQADSLERGWLASWIGLGMLSLCFLGSAWPKPKTWKDDLP